MALDGVLSAIKVLMLDAPKLPDSVDARVELFKDMFPSLTAEETEDLANINPEKLGTYTMTIFAGERSGLRNHFKMSLAALERNWNQCGEGEFDDFHFVKEMHKARPWKTNKFRDLAENFKIHLTEDEPKYTQVIPELNELLNFELTVLDVRRHANDGPEARDSLRLSDLASLTVPEVLGLSYQIPTYNRFRIYNWDFPAAKLYFKEHKQLIDQFPARKVHTVCSRNINLFSRWTEIPPKLWEFLNKQERSISYELAELADIADEIFPDIEDESVLFAKFLEPIAALTSNGGLILVSS